MKRRIDFLGEHRPDRKLLILYAVQSLSLGPLFFALLIPRAIRYLTLRYTFTDEGISMRWGILFRRETLLTYTRIQDIHLRSHIVERWLGLGRVLIQTASGNSNAEMTIEGILAFEPLRDFIYRRSRGASDTLPAVTSGPAVGGSGPSDPVDPGEADLIGLLGQIADEMAAIRRHLERRT